MVAAIRKWTAIVLRSPDSFDVGRRATAEAPLGMQVSQSLRHVFSGKAAGTLHSRADPLVRFLARAGRHTLLAIPFVEAGLYRFAFECEAKCSRSFLRSLMSSITFCHYVLGAVSAKEAMESMRLVDVARACYLTKRKRLQRPLLTTEMVQRLERCVVSPGVTMLIGSFLASSYCLFS